MAAEAPLYWNFNIVERPLGTRVEWRFSVDSTSNDAMEWLFDVTEHDFASDSWRTIGAYVDIDGAPLPASEMPGEIGIMGSLDGYGAREVTFGRFGSLSPLRSSFLRSPRRIQITGIRGTLGGSREYRLFDGQLRGGHYTATAPSSASITAQDALIGLNKPLIYTLAARSFTSRATVIAEICELAGIIPGDWDLPDDTGGYVVKEINEGGDVTVGAFLAEFLAPTGRRYRQRDGKLDIIRFTAQATPVKTLPLDRIHSLTITPPELDAPNAVRFGSAIYPYVGPDLTGTVVTTVDTTGTYAPAVGITLQNHTTGALTATGATPTSATRTTRRVVTTSTYSGGTVTSYTQEVWTWYAPKAANRRQNADGSTRHNDTIDVWQYADGTWRSQSIETFQITELRSVSRTFDATTNRLQYETESRKVYHNPVLHYATLNGALAEVYVTDRYMGSSGVAVEAAVEAPPASTSYAYSITRWYNYDPVTLRQTTTTENGSFALYSWGMLGGPAIGAYVLGPTASKSYAATVVSQLFEWQRWTHTYAAVTATSHSVAIAKTYQAVNAILATGVSTIPDVNTAGTTNVATPLPTIEYDTANQVPQPASVTARDIASVTEIGEIVTSAENGWCETTDEMELAAADALRETRSHRVSIETDVDFDIQEGDVITIPQHPDFGYASVNLPVWGFDVSLSPERSTMRLECWYVPPELDAP